MYFFVRKKRINELLFDWTEEIKRVFGNVFFGAFRTLEDFLDFLFEYSNQKPFVVIFDEFQNFHYSNPTEFSLFQKVFDLKKENSKLLMIFSGSSYTLMEKIFKDSKEPLFGRASEFIHLSNLRLSDQKEFLKDQNITSGTDQLLLFSLFDGIPKYWEEIAEFPSESIKERVKKILLNRDWIWEEGENILKEEFGKMSASYFSILSAIAKGRRILGEIEQFSGINDAGAYLKNLEKVYGIVERKLPATSRSSKEKKGRYFIRDNFFDFWFKFLETKRNFKEIGQIELAVDQIFDDFNHYLGRKLEEMIIRKIIEENPLKISFTRIGKYWNREGNIDFDVILVNDPSNEAYIFEVKINPQKITNKILHELSEKAVTILELQGFKIKIGKAYLTQTGLRINIS